MAVIDTDTGKLLNYRQLMRGPTYKKNRSISSGNELDWLANKVAGRMKPLTNTINFIQRKYIPSKCRKYVTYGHFYAAQNHMGHKQPLTPL